MTLKLRRYPFGNKIPYYFVKKLQVIQFCNICSIGHYIVTVEHVPKTKITLVMCNVVFSSLIKCAVFEMLSIIFITILNNLSCRSFQNYIK